MSKDKVKGDLIGRDGNGFMLVGYFRRQAKKQGFSQDYIQAVTDEATSGDYDHLLQTLINNMESE